MPRLRRTVKTRRRSSSRRRSSAHLELKQSTRRQVSGIMQICLGVLLWLALSNQAGVMGEKIEMGLTFLFGAWAMLFPIFLIASGISQCFAVTTRMEIKRTTGLLLCLLSFLGMVHLSGPVTELISKKDSLAGAVGFLMSVWFVIFASKAVGYTVLATLFVAGIFIAFEPDVLAFWQLLASLRGPGAPLLTKRPKVKPTRVKDEEEEEEEDEPEEEIDDENDLVEKDAPAPELNIVRPTFAQAEAKKSAPKPKSKDELEMTDTRFEEWTFPSFDLLDSAHSELTVNDEELKSQARLIEEKLREFGIEVTMRDAHPGPTVTQFTLQPAEGVKLSKIESLKDDLALALAAQSLRIEAPIPGKALVGIEMPNRRRTTVHLREILESPQFSQSESSLTLPLGRDVSGEAVVAKLDDMPHLLLAGATGSGKSVCMNTFLTALLFQNAPHELKFILVDPKRVELTPYDNIPHLLTPVITDAEKALQALRWTVAEMGRRLHRFSDIGVRNIAEFNVKQMGEDTIMPRIVVVIDELADLMMRQYRRDTETMVARVAQMARAAGIHLILATQRPSVDVITGLIKANIPTRIAFRTVSSVDSRTILDGVGGEDLLGRGDMLYMTATTAKPVRIQGIFISTAEVEHVVTAVKIAGGGKITEQIGLGEDKNEDDENAPNIDGSRNGPYIDLDADDNGGDDLFFDAVAVVQETGKASASLLQRRLSVGYARAAKLLDIMEKKGLIGPANGAKAREIYIDKMAGGSAE